MRGQPEAFSRVLIDQALREAGWDLHAVVRLPSGVFRPYAGVATAALIFEKLTTKNTKSAKKEEFVWFYDLTADGFSLDDKRTPIETNDIPDVLVKWPGREEGLNSYRVTLERIEENDLTLAAGRYKPVKIETVNHDAPADIMADVIRLEKEIAQKAETLRANLSKGGS